MKKTSVTPSATFDQMPSPSHSVKIGASTTRGKAFAIFTYGSNTAAVRGWRANQKPTSTPPIEPMTKASSRLDQRHPEMLPDHAGDEPVDDLLSHIHRVGEEEGRQQDFAEYRIGREHVPDRDRDDGDQDLQSDKR